MDIDNSPFKKEIDKILKSKDKTVAFNWEVEFKPREPNDVVLSKDPYDVNYVEDYEKKKIYKPMKIINIDFSEDYENNASSDITLICTIPLGLWVKVLYPYRDHLECTLIQRPIKTFTREFQKDEDPITNTYFCVPKIDEKIVGEAKYLDRFTRYELDNKGVVDVHFQLYDLSYEKLRTVTVGNIFRRATCEEVMKSILAKESDKIKTKEGKAIDYIQVVEPDNEEKREHFVIPQGTLLTDIPHYLQKRCGGIYNAGIGRYIRDKTWYIYPLYDTGRFDDEKKTLTVFKIPSMELTNVERTFRTEGDKLYILATDQSSFRDNGILDFLNKGNGVRWADARVFMTEKHFEAKDNKAIISRKQVNHEFLYKDLKESNTVFRSENQIHANPFYEYSKLAARRGLVYGFIWENSKPELLIPGMMVKILYLKKQKVCSIEGVLLKAQTSIQLRGQAVTAVSHTTKTGLFVFANPPNENDENV